MDAYALVRLVYLADREMMRAQGRTITGDRFVALPWGPAGEETLEAVLVSTPDGAWSTHLRSDPRRRTVILHADAPPAALSRADLAAVGAVAKEYGELDPLEIMIATHRLPEFVGRPEGAIIDIQDLARGVGVHSEEGIAEILAHAEEVDEIERFKAHLERPTVHA